MYSITKRFYFSASHQLDSLPDGHKCKRLHGHNYTVTLEFRSETLDEHGFIRDYGSLDGFAEWLRVTLDHRHLNDVLQDPENPHNSNNIGKRGGPHPKPGNAGGMDQRRPVAPTAENIAHWIFWHWRMVFNDLWSVTVSEGDNTTARYGSV